MTWKDALTSAVVLAMLASIVLGLFMGFYTGVGFWFLLCLPIFFFLS